ncbi:MAG TPA: GGDEF domain-containing protein, partial [Treponema sp.]|nr:GGDEF domain-containing protein [Treponema sp.]
MNISINWLDTFIGIAGAGLMITAVIFFYFVWKHFKIESYRSISIVCLASLFYMLSSAVSKTMFLQYKNHQFSIEGFRILELITLVFLGIIPYFLSANLRGPVIFLRLNRILSFLGFLLLPFFILSAYLFPKTFLFDPLVIPVNIVEFKTGSVYMIAQALLALTILYTVIVISIDSFSWQSFKRMRWVQTGLLLCMFLNFSAVWKTLFGYFLDPFNAFAFSRILLGQLVLSVGLAVGYFNHFLKQAHEVHQSRDALEISHNELNIMLFTDTLTGLRNRRGFIADLEKILDSKKPAGILLLDLDNFMEFNECFGDDSGDAILTSVSETLSAQIPSDAALYRMGGDEFAAIVTNISNPDELQDLANTVREISSIGFKASEKTHSFGIAISLVMIPREGETTDTVLSNAYSAMHAAKENNTVCLYSDSLKRDSLLRISTIQLLREDLR